jgi:hypothetical protein
MSLDSAIRLERAIRPEQDGSGTAKRQMRRSCKKKLRSMCTVIHRTHIHICKRACIAHICKGGRLGWDDRAAALGVFVVLSRERKSEMGTQNGGRVQAPGNGNPEERTEGAAFAILGSNYERSGRALAVPFLSWDFALGFCDLIPQGDTGAVNA